MEKVTLKVQYGNFSIEVTGPEEYAEKKLADLLKKYGNMSSLPEGGSNAGPSKPSKLLSPSEFIKQISPKAQSDRALILGYYLEKYQNKENFSNAELAEINKNAKQPTFTNLSDTVANLVQQGLMMGAGQNESKRLYALTTTGEDTVEAFIKAKTKNP